MKDQFGNEIIETVGASTSSVGVDKIQLVISENLMRKSRNMVIYRVENGNRYIPVVYLQPAKHLDKREFDDIVRFLAEHSILREE